MTDTPETLEVEVEEEKQPDLAEILAAFEGSPSKDKIEQWKQQHAEVFCSGFSDNEIFIWRAVARGEFAALQGAAAQSEVPMDMEAALVQTCVLYQTPMGEKSLEGKAGTLSTLHEQILQNSNFMDPRVAAALVIKL